MGPEMCIRDRGREEGEGGKVPSPSPSHPHTPCSGGRCSGARGAAPSPHLRREASLLVNRLDCAEDVYLSQLFARLTLGFEMRVRSSARERGDAVAAVAATAAVSAGRAAVAIVWRAQHVQRLRTDAERRGGKVAERVDATASATNSATASASASTSVAASASASASASAAVASTSANANAGAGAGAVHASALALWPPRSTQPSGAPLRRSRPRLSRLRLCPRHRLRLRLRLRPRLLPLADPIEKDNRHTENDFMHVRR